MIISRTPFRISFYGGGTDFPAWFQQHGGTVLATSIDKYCYISCRNLPPFFEHQYRIVYSLIENANTIAEIEHPAARAVLDWADCHNRGLEIHHDGDLPARSGLGSSSSFTVGLINAIKALDGRHITKEDLAQHAIHLEQNVLQENVGSQDQVTASYGGLNRIDFLENGLFRVSPVILPKQRLDDFQDHLMIFFTGLSRISSDIAKTQIENIAQCYNELTKMKTMVDEATAILQSTTTDLRAFGELLHENWQYKKRLSPKISTPFIDDIYALARKHGAIGGKVTGAGGGGFLLLFVPPERQGAVKKALGDLIHVPFRFETEGSRIVLYKPEGLK